ncbi:MAG: CD225/dispanin family protein [Muribaculaceae bacterium]|nr:CD225/dispanin family protein [Muribaculaceae bacterium]
MRKIVVFTSGDAAAAERLITLFNEGNRIRVEAVVTDGDAESLRERFHEEGVEVIGVTPECAPDELAQIGETLESRGVEIYAFENYDGLMSGWVKDHHPTRVLLLSTPREAPREVVAALAALDKAVDSSAVASTSQQPKTVDEEWAETLQIDFDSKRAEEAAARAAEMAQQRSGGVQVPPPVPGQVPPVPPVQGAPDFTRNPQYGHGYGPQDPRYNQGYGAQNGGQPYQQPSGTPQYQQQGGQQYNYYGNRPVNDEPMPPTYLVWSVIMTVLCCFIPGIVAIIFSSQVSTKYYSGDMEGAKRASRNAEIWIIVSFVLGVLSATLYMPIMMVSGS